MLSINTLKPLAQSIKEETEVQHMALEDLIVPLIQEIHSTKDYLRLLHLFYGFNKPMEEAIRQIITTEILPDINKRQKADLILSDLSRLGFDKIPSQHSNIPETNTLEQAFGALYVLEGSSLGGKSITQLLLKRNIGITTDHLQFFNAYGKETGPMWLAFIEQLNTFSAPGQQKVIIQTANETFIKFKHWIQQQAPQKR